MHHSIVYKTLVLHGVHLSQFCSSPAAMEQEASSKIDKFTVTEAATRAALSAEKTLAQLITINDFVDSSGFCIRTSNCFMDFQSRDIFSSSIRIVQYQLTGEFNLRIDRLALVQTVASYPVFSKDKSYLDTTLVLGANSPAVQAKSWFHLSWGIQGGCI